MTSDDKKDGELPFISDSSPSNSRARKEWRDPAPTADPELVGAVLRLIEIEHGAVKAYAAAFQKGVKTEPLTNARARHSERVTQLSEIARELGATAPSADEADDKLLPVAATDIDYLSDREEIARGLAHDEKFIADELERLIERDMPDAIQQRLSGIRAAST